MSRINRSIVISDVARFLIVISPEGSMDAWPNLLDFITIAWPDAVAGACAAQSTVDQLIGPETVLAIQNVKAELGKDNVILNSVM